MTAAALTSCLTAYGQHTPGQDLVDHHSSPTVDLTWSRGTKRHHRETVLRLRTDGKDGRVTLRAVVTVATESATKLTRVTVDRLTGTGWHNVVDAVTTDQHPAAYPAHDAIAEAYAPRTGWDDEERAEVVDAETRLASDYALGYAAQTLGLSAPANEVGYTPSASS